MKSFVIFAIIVVLGICLLAFLSQEPKHASRNYKFLSLDMDDGVLEVATGSNAETRLLRRDNEGNVLFERVEKKLPLYRNSSVRGLVMETGILLSSSYYGEKTSRLYFLDFDLNIVSSKSTARAITKLFPLRNGGFAAATIGYSDTCPCGDDPWLQFYSEKGEMVNEEWIRRSSSIHQEATFTTLENGYVYYTDDKRVNLQFDANGKKIE